MRWLALVVGVLAVLVVAVLQIAPGRVERGLQGVVPHEPYAIGAAAAERHAALTVVDWHADSLLWERDLLERSDRGHVDVPRLEEGNVAVQVFTIVSKSPRGQNYERNATDAPDNITPLVIVQGWPPATWTSLLQRALHQSQRLHELEERAPERIRVVRTSSDLRDVLNARSRSDGRPRPVAGILGIEGAHALDGELANLERLDEAGFRMIGLHHFFDNRLGGSLHGQSGAGLTEFGRAVVRGLEERRIIVDVAHSSEAVVDDVLAMATRPVVVSHTGVKGVCDSARNISDAHMKRIAKAGGLIAIGYWDGAVCDITPAGVVRSIRYAIDLVGEDHVALGSDFDGATTTRFDTSELAVLTQEMQRRGFRDREIEKVMGGNSVRFLLAQLPPG